MSVQIYSPQEEVAKLNINQEKTWTETEKFYENGILSKIEERKIYVKKTAGTQTAELTIITKDKDGNKTSELIKTFYESQGWGDTISNWFKSWKKK